ncbi:SHOCT domain-containing protein [Agromyces sp. SYSU T00194]|uniref:SHOCT domain-containing protein n=1 Tax=Agromyces chitinivorans TaxID=3158560 RepID=UPI00339154CD
MYGNSLMGWNVLAFVVIVIVILLVLGGLVALVLWAVRASSRPTPGPVAHASGLAVPAADGPKPVASTTLLRELADLRDQEIITPEEFEAKKAEILGRL